MSTRRENEKVEIRTNHAGTKPAQTSEPVELSEAQLASVSGGMAVTPVGKGSSSPDVIMP